MVNESYPKMYEEMTKTRLHEKSNNLETSEDFGFKFLYDNFKTVSHKCIF